MLSTILISVAILAACIVITYRGAKNRRQGRHSCSCGGSCGSCGCGDLCHGHKNTTTIP